MSLFNTQKTDDKDQWLSISDMMSVMMFIFMIIAIVYARSFSAEPTEKCEQLFMEIENEFKNDFNSEEWQAKLDKDLTIRFENPEVLFENDSAKIRPKFAKILQNFWPRYIKLLKQYEDKNKNSNDIKEIRIEGHTSKDGGYFHNMVLSQKRTRSILQYVFKLQEMKNQKDWMIKYITANGLSYANPKSEGGKYSAKKSRRVEFRSVSKACLKSGYQE